MGPIVIVAYHDYDYPDMTVEEEILGAIDARIVQVKDLLGPNQSLRQAEALMVTTRPVTAEMLARLPRCRIVSRAGVGVDEIDIEAATQRGIWVTNVPDYGIDEVSTHAIALLLAHARGLPPLLDATRQGIWDYRIVKPLVRLRGQTLGVIGFGRIGSAVAMKGRGLGLNVLAHAPFVADTVVEGAGVKPVSFETLLQEADFVTLHTPLTQMTRGMIDSRALARMKPNAFLINTARGALVDEEALREALAAGRIAGAALDVLSVEPPDTDHPLLHDPRVWITPHSAWYSEAAAYDMRAGAAQEVVRVLRGEQPRSRINQIGAP